MAMVGQIWSLGLEFDNYASDQLVQMDSCTDTENVTTDFSCHVEYVNDPSPKKTLEKI